MKKRAVRIKPKDSASRFFVYATVGISALFVVICLGLYVSYLNQDNDNYASSGELLSLGSTSTPILDIGELECRGQENGKKCNKDIFFYTNQGVCLNGRCKDCLEICNYCQDCTLLKLTNEIFCNYRGDNQPCQDGDSKGVCEYDLNGEIKCKPDNQPNPGPSGLPPLGDIFIPVPDTSITPEPTTEETPTPTP